jgi:hypothetical protein
MLSCSKTRANEGNYNVNKTLDEVVFVLVDKYQTRKEVSGSVIMQARPNVCRDKLVIPDVNKK